MADHDPSSSLKQSRDVFDVHDTQQQRQKNVPHADFFPRPLDTRESEHTLNHRVTVA
jgi:hypothetical protein